MRQALANALLVSTTLAGCSVFYDTGELPNIDAASDTGPDAEIIVDADPTMITVESVKPAQIFEGQGVDGSRPAVLLIQGTNFVDNGTMVALSAAAGAPMVTVDNSMLEVDLSGKLIAVPVTVAVDAAASDTIALDIAVTQNTPGGPIS